MRGNKSSSCNLFLFDQKVRDEQAMFGRTFQSTAQLSSNLYFSEYTSGIVKRIGEKHYILIKMPQYVVNNIKVMVQCFVIFTHIAEDQINPVIRYYTSQINPNAIHPCGQSTYFLFPSPNF